MNAVIGVIILLIFPLFGFGQYAEYDWQERDEWMPVERIFKLAGIENGSQVADIGCHEGYLSIHLANAVGKGGKVYAVDVRRDRLDLLRDHLKTRWIRNVKVILGDYDNPKLPEGQLDVVMIIDTYHEMNDYKDILKHVYKALKPGGRLVILEKMKRRVRSGTRAEQTDAHSLSHKYVRPEMEAAQFIITKEIDDLGDWENDADKPMWLLIGEKEKDSKWRSGKL
ncbi:MAG: methyltransferase domain-containing protein [Flavobacteriaceae bacterium]|nr:methyltransferase domain-containing protein [Flavobacteriaceae bacterium]NNK72840.1 methyltransferase domain-containing protein [Flavobacteriaceae bacterium]